MIERLFGSLGQVRPPDSRFTRFMGFAGRTTELRGGEALDRGRWAGGGGSIDVHLYFAKYLRCRSSSVLRGR